MIERATRLATRWLWERRCARGAALHRQKCVQNISVVTNSFKVQDSNVTCDPFRLFQRISVFMTSQKCRNALEQFLCYELSPYPLALFDAAGMRKTNKAALHTIFEPKTDATVPKDWKRIIDGGWLLHHGIWPESGTYEDIMNSYIAYVQRDLGCNCVIVFDGYSADDTSRKTAERGRRYTIDDLLLTFHLTKRWKQLLEKKPFSPATKIKQI